MFVWFISYLFIIFSVQQLLQSTEQNEFCTDTLTNQTYLVGKYWTHENVCEKYKCEKKSIPAILRKFSFPIIITYRCGEPVPPDNDMRNCYERFPYPDAKYPQCCKHLVCFRNNKQYLIYPDSNNMIDEESNEIEEINETEEINEELLVSTTLANNSTENEIEIQDSKI